MTQMPDPVRGDDLAAAATPAPVEPSSRTPGGVFVGLMVALACALFLIAAAVLYHRWLGVREPDSSITILADESADGVTVRITGVAMSRPCQITLDRQNRRPEFHLLAGSYTITLMRGDHTIERRQITLPAGEHETLTCTRVSATQPAADADNTSVVGDAEHRPLMTTRSYREGRVSEAD